MIRLLIVDDNAVVRKGISRLLRDEPGLEAIGEAADGVAALALLRGGLKPDVMLIDFNMPVMDGLELTRQVTRLYPRIAVVILTMHLQSVYCHQALAAGAKGYLLKGEDENELFRCIRAVHHGKIFVSPGLPV